MLKALVIGHLGKDAVINHVNGKTVINFTVAHTEKYKDAAGASHEKTTWVDCSYWTDRTAVAPYLQKGTQVFVEGTPEVRTFQRNDGSTGAAFALRVREIQLLGKKETQGNQGNGQRLNENIPVHSSLHTTNGGPGYAQSMEEVADDLPF
jgi:single-strand DNA-binding protein